MSSSARFIFGVIAAVLIFIGFLMTYFTVNQNERTVVTRFGQLVYVADPGLHFKMPFVNSTQAYRVDVEEVHPRDPVNTYTVDNQEVDVIFNVFYRLPPDKVAYIYENVRDYKDRLYTMAIDRLKVEMGKVNVTSVAEKRGELRDMVRSVLMNDARSIGVEVTDFTLTDLRYTKSFRDAVELAAAQKAGIETREYERQQAQKTAETAAIAAEGAANAVRAKARGDADARLLAATAEAKAIQLQGEAQAAAIQAQTRALADNPSYVQLRQAERWNGVLPQWTTNSQPLPIINPALPR